MASYNVHECVGPDGVRDPARVAAVVGELGAGVVGLQEVASHPSLETPAGQLEFLAGETGMTPVYGPTLSRRGGEYGNGLLTRLPVVEVWRHDLSLPRREPRGALEARLAAGGVSLRVVVTHLGLDRRERAQQAVALLDLLRLGGSAEPTVVLGDLNEWSPSGPALRILRRGLGPAPAPRSFPSRFPLLALDRIWASPTALLEWVRPHRTPRARQASDHLPVVGSLDLQRAIAPH